MFATAIALTLGCNRSEPAKEQSDWDALRAEVSSLRKCLAQDGAYAFVTNAATPKTAPQFSEAFSLDPRLAFYMKDINRVNASLRALWNDKDHEEVCVYGMFCKVPKMVERILEFRKIAGEIPAPSKDDLGSTEQQELYVGKINDIWLSKHRGQISKPVGRLVLWVYTGMLNDSYSRAL